MLFRRRRRRPIVERALRGHPVRVRSAEGRAVPAESRAAAAQALRARIARKATR